MNWVCLRPFDLIKLLDDKAHTQLTHASHDDSCRFKPIVNVDNDNKCNSKQNIKVSNLPTL